MTSETTDEAGVGVWRCPHCGERFFPRRLLCLKCHTPEMTHDRIDEAQVEEISVIRHMLGQTDWKPRRIANVRTPDGLALTVGLEDDAAIGDRIRLYQPGTAPFGRKA